MFIRAFALLFAVIALSLAATLYFGHEVLIALGLILTQVKIIAKKLAMVEVPMILAWLKVQTSAFLRIELIKKWVMTTLLPLLVGSAVLRRFAAFLARYRSAIRRRYRRLLLWYGRLRPAEKLITGLIMMFAMLTLSVTSVGLWLILFSVKFPLWIAAAAAALWRMTWVSAQKMAFKAVAFLQLSWAWRFVKRLLPRAWLERKRRFDYRVARAVIRRRRMTVRQLATRKDNLAFRFGVMADYVTGRNRQD